MEINEQQFQDIVTMFEKTQISFQYFTELLQREIVGIQDELTEIRGLIGNAFLEIEKATELQKRSDTRDRAAFLELEERLNEEKSRLFSVESRQNALYELAVEAYEKAQRYSFSYEKEPDDEYMGWILKRLEKDGV